MLRELQTGPRRRRGAPRRGAVCKNVKLALEMGVGEKETENGRREGAILMWLFLYTVVQNGLLSVNH